MYLSQQHNFLFCHVPRTGGTSLAEHIFNKDSKAERVFLQHLSLREAKEIIGPKFNNLFKFAFVRNPWERFVSWHALTALCNVGYDKNSPDINVLPGSSHWLKFDQFLEEVATKKVNKFRGDWLEHSQWLQLTDLNGNLLVDELGRYENYTQDCERFLSKIGISGPNEINMNGSKHLHYSEYYSDFGKELVEEVFKEDVVNFGYHFERT